MSIYLILAASCMKMLGSLAVGVPMRGAVCIGTGTILPHGSFYGPALAEAHYLESKEARYPRVLISPAVDQLIAEGTRYSNDDGAAKFMDRMAAICRSLVCKDKDQKSIVDWLGTGFQGVHQGSAQHKAEAAEKAYRFVESECERFWEAGDDKLASRYELLRRYIKPRLPAWRVSK
jgi:hypothetical protein